MYGKELPFYDISSDYLEDEINLNDIYFLIWYYISILDESIIIDPYFENDQSFNKAVLKIFNLFEQEFEDAPQNEDLQNFLLLSGGSDVKTVREKLSFIACHSFLFEHVFDKFIKEVIEEYKENDVVVLDEKSEVQIYDSQIHFVFNENMPLLSMRTNEYFAEILGKEHSEYQFIKNISKRITGCFLIRKIEKDGFLIEHLSSKKQLWLSNEFTSLQGIDLVENKTVLTISMVQWKDNVWQNQGGCLVNELDNMKGMDISEHLFDDESLKMKTIQGLETAFLEVSNCKRFIYFRRYRDFLEFYLKVLKKHKKNANPKIKDRELDEAYKNFVENNDREIPVERNEPIGIFFNSNSGVEIYREELISCMPDKNNPYYANEKYDLCDLVTIETFSMELVNYIIENEIINICVCDYENSDMFNIIMDNFDFLLRFYRRSHYFSKPEITINNSK